MSENSWQNKGYGDYFESLEKQLNKSKEIDNKISHGKLSRFKSARKFKGGVYRIRKSVIAVGLAMVLIVVGTVVISGFGKLDNADSNKDTQSTVSSSKSQENVKKPLKIKYEFNADTVQIPASNDAKNAIIINKKTNNVVAERNAHQKAYPASTTKIMTLLVAAEHLKDMEDTFTMSLEITDPLFVAEASVAGFLNNEQVTVKDLFYGTILPSGADAAMGLAIKTAGSEAEFVKLMNEKVAELGLENTHFANVTGLHDVQNYTTAYDMAVMLDAAMHNEFCKKVLSTYQHTTAKTPQNPNGILLSNTIFEYMYGTEPETATILGGKTGFVNESGYCIASFGVCNENENEYIVVTFGNSSRWPAFHGQIDLYKEFAK